MSKRTSSTIDADVEKAGSAKAKINKKHRSNYSYFTVIGDNLQEKPEIYAIFRDEESALDFKRKKEEEIKADTHEDDLEYLEGLVILETTMAGLLKGQVLVVLERHGGDHANVYDINPISNARNEKKMLKDIIEPGVQDYLEELRSENSCLEPEDEDGEDGNDAVEAILEEARAEYFEEHEFFSKVLTL